MYALKQNDQLNKYISLAVLSHIVVVLLTIGINFLMGINPFKFEIKKEVNLIQSAIQIDIVALPKHTLKELERIDLTRVKEVVTVEKHVESKETSKIELKVKKKKMNMKDLLKNYREGKIEKNKKKVKRTKFNNADLKKLILEGNIASEGSSTTGEKVDETQEVFVRYIQSLPARVRPHWKLPSYLLKKELRCRIRIFLAANGKILKANIYESSGDKEYDQKAKDSVMKSSPLPIPTKDIRSRVLTGDVILGFPL